MHAAAEFGDASHNLYKGGIKSLSSAQKFADSVRKTNIAVLSSDSSLVESSPPSTSFSSSSASSATLRSKESSSAQEVEKGGARGESGLGVAGEALRIALADEVQQFDASTFFSGQDSEETTSATTALARATRGSSEESPTYSDSTAQVSVGRHTVLVSYCILSYAYSHTLHTCAHADATDAPSLRRQCAH